MSQYKYTYDVVTIDGNQYVKGEYNAIVFNDIFLPPGAGCIDVLAGGNFFNNIDDELSLWFWRFTICMGGKYSEQSSIVINHSKMLLQLMVDNRPLLSGCCDSKA